MPLSSLHNLLKEIQQIREYLNHIKLINNLAGTILEQESNLNTSLVIELRDHFRNFGTDKRVFEYKAVIISLYGILEKYCEIWIKEYLESLSSIIRPYSKLDDKIKDNHFNLSLKLINTISTQKRAKFQNLSKEDIIRRLNSCINDESEYIINTEAFLPIGGGNLNHERLSDLFKFLNIDIKNGLKKNKELIKYLKDELQLKNIANLSSDKLYETINDLVIRRNEIAHGAGSIDNILALRDQEAYVNFTEKYCIAIFETLEQYIYSHELKYQYEPITSVKRVWRKKILGFEASNCEIQVGDYVFIKKNKSLIKEPILEIKIKNVSRRKCKIKVPTEVTIRVACEINTKYSFFKKKNIKK